VSIKNQALLTLREQLSSSRLLVIRVVHLFSFLSCVVFCLRSVSCVPNIVCTSGLSLLECPFVYVFCVCFFVCFVLCSIFFFVPSLVCPILPVSVECPFFGFP
jgi:hypothetical protein